MTESNPDRKSFEEILAQYKRDLQNAVEKILSGECDAGLHQWRPTLDIERLKRSVILQLNAWIEAIDEINVDEVDQAVSQGILVWEKAIQNFRTQTEDVIKVVINVGALLPKEPTAEESQILERIKNTTADYFAVLTELITLLESPEGQAQIQREVEREAAKMQTQLKAQLSQFKAMEESVLGDFSDSFGNPLSELTSEIADQFGSIYERLIPMWKEVLPQIQNASDVYIRMLGAGELDQEKLSKVANELQTQLDECKTRLQNLKEALGK